MTCSSSNSGDRQQPADEQRPSLRRSNLDRLVQEGYSDADARILIAQCVAAELFNVMKHNKPHDNERYVRNLRQLPDFPSED